MKKLQKIYEETVLTERKKLIDPEFIDYEMRILAGNIRRASELFATADYKEILKTLTEAEKDITKMKKVVNDMAKVHKKRG